MKLYEKYSDINRVCEMIREQIIDSIPFAYANCPKFSNPTQLFKWLRSITHYKNDPPGYEFIQEMKTLFSHVKHRTGRVFKSGEGDCDCFVVTSIACMYVQGWMDNFGFVLAGRLKSAPVHIYAYVVFKNKYYIFDLTQPVINKVRDYPIQQQMKL